MLGTYYITKKAAEGSIKEAPKAKDIKVEAEVKEEKKAPTKKTNKK